MDRLKELLKEESEISADEQKTASEQNYVEVVADSIEEGLAKASKQLKCGIAELEYEIIEKGSNGFFGVGKKPYKFQIKKVTGKTIQQTTELEEFASITSRKVEEFEAPLEVDKDSYIKIRITRNGVILSIFPPKGKGRKITVDEVMQAIYDRQIANVDMQLIKNTVEKTKAEGAKVSPIKIAEWQTTNPEFDSRCNVEIAEDEMKAYLTVVPPRKNGRSMDYDDIASILTEKGISYGIQEEQIRKILEEDVFNQPMEIALGDMPVHGEDSKIEYKFRVDKSQIQLSEDEHTGRIDYRELDLIENVVQGQILAVKIPASEGHPGKTVTNKRIEARTGKDKPIPMGKGVKLSDDGLQIISEINGQVVLTKDKISVEPIYEIRGDVSMETGNIVFLGTVIVRGNVNDGFSVKAAGNIDIRGAVGRASLEAEGDVVIKQGLAGKDEAVVVAGGDVVAKFIERAKLISAGNDVIISEGLMHSNVSAGKRIICNGRRAMIVGGKIRAGEEVNVKTLGSPAYTETLIEVGIDPKSREQLLQLEEDKRVSKDNLSKLTININTLLAQKKSVRTQFSQEKEEMLQTMQQQKNDVVVHLNEVEEQINEIKSYLNVLEEKGKVCVQQNVYPKVKIVVKTASLEVKDPFKYVTFVQEAGNIKILPYEEVKVDVKKVAYSKE